MTRTRRSTGITVVASAVMIGAFSAAAPVGTAPAGVASSRSLPPIQHVFVINLENKGYNEAFGPGSPAPYLAQTLTSQGVLLSDYYGTGHESNDNYLAQISGQGPNPANQSDCQKFVDFTGSGTAPPGQAVGQGCVFPASVLTVADQLVARGLSWKGYMEDMGNDPSREAAQCAHPAIDATDGTQTAEVGDQYATRHDPFVYFHSIIDTPACARDVVPLSQLPSDPHSVRTTPNLTYITPNLCNDGHDSPCIDGPPGGLTSANAWLSTWIPQIRPSWPVSSVPPI